MATQNTTNNKVAETEAAFVSLRLKYRKSVSIYIALTVLTFAMVALTLILSIWAVQVGNPDAKIYFIGIAVVTALIGFLNGLISTFTFGVTARKVKTKITEINAEKVVYEADGGDYAKLADSKAKLEAFVRKTTTIYNA